MAFVKARKIMNTFNKVTRSETNKFGFNALNRKLNHGHVNKLKERMKNDLQSFPAITVNSVTNNVTDGQHRLTAFQRLVDEGQLPADSTIYVMYINKPAEKEMEEIIDANTGSVNWSLDNFIESHSKRNFDYQKLNEFCMSHVLCNDGNKKKYRYGAAMLKGVNCVKSLKDGTFSLTIEEIKKGEIIHDELLEILTILKFQLKGNFVETLSTSWSEVRDFHTFKEWIKELKLKKNALSKKNHDNKKDWDEIFGSLHRSIDLKN